MPSGPAQWLAALPQVLGPLARLPRVGPALAAKALAANHKQQVQDMAVAADRVVAVHTDDERIGAPARAKQYVHVARVQQIEHAIREGEAAPHAGPPGPRPRPVHDFFSGVERDAQNEPAACGVK